jgi:tetratricopeptide (TPR) repeat protein
MTNTDTDRHRGKHRLLLTVIVAVFALLASSAAIYMWAAQQSTMVRLAISQERTSRAEQNFAASVGAIGMFVSSLADNLSNPKGLQVHDVVTLLGNIESAVATLVAKTEDNPEVRRRQGAMLIQFSATYLALGNTELAVASARRGSDIFRALARAQSDNDDIQSNVGLSLAKLGEALRASGDFRGALAADRESLEIARALANTQPRNRQFQTDVVLALWRLASAGDDSRARLTEALKILKNMKLAAMLQPPKEEWIGTIEDDLSHMP